MINDHRAHAQCRIIARFDQQIAEAKGLAVYASQEKAQSS
jgi:hypothetical protein